MVETPLHHVRADANHPKKPTTRYETLVITVRTKELAHNVLTLARRDFLVA